ncbi:hypothetical protein QFC24_003849 [Naganishia onofrii]|uniref:Uncharacterized protein n=1 Tax=Naganishia onofrii TaxID=1851511 RepID=A0ACC2XJ13_9TREE|nr:hypothetical protein QFC24_003849 [Naganishia onofrii]
MNSATLMRMIIIRRRMRQFREQAQALPTTNTQTYPSNYQQPQNNSYYTAQFQPPPGAPPVSKPPQTYQPSAAGQYGGVGGVQEHDYEYRQAEENRRLEEEEARRLGTEPPPPTYDAVTGRMNSNSK